MTFDLKTGRTFASTDLKWQPLRVAIGKTDPRKDDQSFLPGRVDIKATPA